MVPEDKFEILNAAAWRAACKFNKNPEDQQDCYDFVLYHAALKNWRRAQRQLHAYAMRLPSP